MSACIAAGVRGTGTSSSSNLPSSNDTSSGESFISPAIDVELLIAPKRYSPSQDLAVRRDLHAVRAERVEILDALE